MLTYEQLPPAEQNRAVVVTTNDMIEALAKGSIELRSPLQDHVTKAIWEGVKPPQVVRSEIVKEILSISLAIVQDSLYSDEYRLTRLMGRR